MKRIRNFFLHYVMFALYGWIGGSLCGVWLASSSHASVALSAFWGILFSGVGLLVGAILGAEIDAWRWRNSK